MTETEHQGTVAMTGNDEVPAAYMVMDPAGMYPVLPNNAEGYEGTFRPLFFRADTPAPTGQTEGVDIPRLPIGTAVNKVLGYPFPGTVVAAFHTLSGQERFVVEATGDGYRGMLHIFNGDQLRAAASEGTK